MILWIKPWNRWETNMEEVLELWDKFVMMHPEAKNSTYQVWAFGSNPAMADSLLSLVLEGKKTATSSAKKLFDYDDEPLPKEKEYSIILNGKNQPRAVIQTITVDEIAFCDVPAEFAYLEGEDDRSLEQWRHAHLNYFQEVFRTYGLKFTEEEMLYCETFRVCYRA